MKFTRLVLPFLSMLVVIGCGGGGSAAPPATTTDSKPSIILQPQAQAVAPAGSVTFTVRAAPSTSPLTYQWFRDGAYIPGATGSSLTMSAIGCADSMSSFSVEVSNLLGIARSEPAHLSVSPCDTPTVARIVTQPKTLTVSPSEPATFSVEVATSTSPQNYQWLRNGMYIAGATGSSLRISNTACADSATMFSVEVSNGVNTVRSELAQLVVSPCAARVLAGQINFPVDPNLDGPVDRVGFRSLSAISVGRDGSVYVAGSAIVRRISMDNQVATLVGKYDEYGPIDGPKGVARLYGVPSMVVDSKGNVLMGNYDHVVRKVTPDGTVSVLAGEPGQTWPTRFKGTVDGTGTAAGFSGPYSLAMDPDDNLIVLERGVVNPNIETVRPAYFGGGQIRKVTPNGIVTTIADLNELMKAFAPASGTALSYGYMEPTMAVDQTGNILVADGRRNVIWKLTSSGQFSLLAGAYGVGGSTDGRGASARFNSPSAIAVDRYGNAYVAEHANFTVRKITPDGNVSTLAGTAGKNGIANGKASESTFNGIEGISVDTKGNVYVVGEDSSVRVITPDGWVRVFAGSNSPSGNGIGAMAYASGISLASDSFGNLFVLSSTDIRKVTQEGVVSTHFGKGRYSTGVPVMVDGIYGPEAKYPLDPENLSYAHDLAIDALGNVFVTDYISVRKISPAGVATVLVPPAYGFHPEGIAVDTSGNVYFSEPDRQIVRKLTPTGDLTVIAGKLDTSGFDDGPTGVSRLYYPRGLAVGENGTVYIADNANCAVRKILPTGHLVTVAKSPGNSTSDWACDGLVPGFGTPNKLTVGANGMIFVTSRFNEKMLLQISPTGLSSLVPDIGGWGALVGRIDGITTGPKGELYVTRDMAIVRVQLPL